MKGFIELDGAGSAQEVEYNWVDGHTIIYTVGGSDEAFITHYKSLIEHKPNQCDGCARGLPIKDGVHKGSGYDMIGCTKNLYK